MKQEELLKALIEELMQLDELHLEYQDNESYYVIDYKKEGDTLTIKITLNKDKKEFENWLSKVDDDLFEEVMEELGNAFDLNQAYSSDNYKEVIDKVKSKTKEIASRKIEELKALL